MTTFNLGGDACNSFSFDFAQNAVVTSSIGIQVSGEPVLIPKSSS